MSEREMISRSHPENEAIRRETVKWQQETNKSLSELQRENDALRAENEKLREALKPFADDAKYCQNLYKLLDDNMWNVPVKWLNAAAAAIRETDAH